MNETQRKARYPGDVAVRKGSTVGRRKASSPTSTQPVPASIREVPQVARRLPRKVAAPTLDKFDVPAPPMPAPPKQSSYAPKVTSDGD